MQPHSLQYCLDAAEERRREMNLSYSGALTPPEARAMLRGDSRAALVDVRTAPELLYVGRAPESVYVEWQVFPEMTVNENFCEQLSREVSRDRPALFLCRSGVRSHHAAAAAAAAGWRAYNILEGFEGDLDGGGRRGNINGWRFHGLPWTQS
ncbi:MAG: rhodanese-like domain-containing protein [Gammaproteobacteria bacterium]